MKEIKLSKGVAVGGRIVENNTKIFLTSSVFFFLFFIMNFTCFIQFFFTFSQLKENSNYINQEFVFFS